MTADPSCTDSPQIALGVGPVALKHLGRLLADVEVVCTQLLVVLDIANSTWHVPPIGAGVTWT